MNAYEFQIPNSQFRIALSASPSELFGHAHAAGRVTAHKVRGDEVTLEAEIPERLLERYREHLQ